MHSTASCAPPSASGGRLAGTCLEPCRQLKRVTGHSAQQLLRCPASPGTSLPRLWHNLVHLEHLPELSEVPSGPIRSALAEQLPLSFLEQVMLSCLSVSSGSSPSPGWRSATTDTRRLSSVPHVKSLVLPAVDQVRMVPKEGFEPTHPCGQRILSPPRLPFRHFGAACPATERGMERKRGFEPPTLTLAR